MVFNELGEATKPDKELILINPKIISNSEETDLREEGCLSFPLIHGKVYRYKWIEIEYQNLQGNVMKMKLEGFPARIFQHEYDHLDKVKIYIILFKTLKVFLADNVLFLKHL